jgi:hypothetical protein
VLGSLGQALSDDLGVERVGKDLCPIFERPVGGDAGRSSEVVTLGDDLEGELGLCGVHGEHGEVVNDEQLGAHVASEGAFEGAVDLGAVQVIEHPGAETHTTRLVAWQAW